MGGFASRIYDTFHNTEEDLVPRVQELEQCVSSLRHQIYTQKQRLEVCTLNELNMRERISRVTEMLDDANQRLEIYHNVLVRYRPDTVARIIASPVNQIWMDDTVESQYINDILEAVCADISNLM